jgi:hypothetical protein
MENKKSTRCGIILIRDLARILRPLVIFAEQIFWGLIMNKQEYNDLNLIISYVALLVGNGD